MRKPRRHSEAARHARWALQAVASVQSLTLALLDTREAAARLRLLQRDELLLHGAQLLAFLLCERFVPELELELLELLALPLEGGVFVLFD